MADTLKMQNPIFRVQDLYKMLRLSMIKYLPYETQTLSADEILTIYMQKTMSSDFKVEEVFSESGNLLAFSGKSYEMFKTREKEEEGSNHSPAWYISKLAKWNVRELNFLESDLRVMKTWLEINDFTRQGLPTEKFLKQELLEIADAAEERRRNGI
ncbi:hypothetical protein AAF463_25200 (plasmid) [Pantoea sp. BJ2]|uniref:Uncharacterized protein n=1 Tax=Pantoea sp. BJ2 TaxID=3141322 RepID=A0AAU7U3M4_9GAMM